MKKLNPAHWASQNNKIFFPREPAQKLNKLPPGVYSIRNSIQGIYFEKNAPDTTDLLRFDDDSIDKCLKEVSTFWAKKDLFEKHKFPFKRGILLYGPPGTGKTSILKLVIKEIVDMGGIALNFQDVGLFQMGLQQLRGIEQSTPIVVIMEDLDSLLEYNNQSEVLNLLDGVGGFQNIIFIATTNYISRLEGRIKNRPSRFDRRFFIDFINAKSRKMYLQHIIGHSEEFKDIDIDQWVADTAEMTPAHLKELFLSVSFFGNEYGEVIERLKKMQGSEDYDDDIDSNDNDNDDYDIDSSPKCIAASAN